MYTALRCGGERPQVKPMEENAGKEMSSTIQELVKAAVVKGEIVCCSSEDVDVES